MVPPITLDLLLLAQMSVLQPVCLPPCPDPISGHPGQIQVSISSFPDQPGLDQAATEELALAIGEIVGQRINECAAR